MRSWTKLPHPKTRKKQHRHVPGAVGVEKGGLTVGASLWGGLVLTGGGLFPWTADGKGTSAYGGDNAMVLGLGDLDGSMSLIFWGDGAVVEGGNVFGGL